MLCQPACSLPGLSVRPSVRPSDHQVFHPAISYSTKLEQRSIYFFNSGFEPDTVVMGPKWPPHHSTTEAEKESGKEMDVCNQKLRSHNITFAAPIFLRHILHNGDKWSEKKIHAQYEQRVRYEEKLCVMIQMARYKNPARIRSNPKYTGRSKIPIIIVSPK